MSAPRSELIAGWFAQYTDCFLPLPGVLPEGFVMGCGLLDPDETVVMLVDPDLIAEQTEGWTDVDLVALLNALEQWAEGMVPFVYDGVIPSRAVAYLARAHLERCDPVAARLITRAVGNAGYLGDPLDQDAR